MTQIFFNIFQLKVFVIFQQNKKNHFDNKVYIKYHDFIRIYVYIFVYYRSTVIDFLYSIEKNHRTHNFGYSVSKFPVYPFSIYHKFR